MVQASYAAAQVPVGTVPVAPPGTTSANSVNQAVTGLMCPMLPGRVVVRRQSFRVILLCRGFDSTSGAKEKSQGQSASVIFCATRLHMQAS